MHDLKTWLRAEWDRVVGYALVGIGGLALLLGFNGVSSSPFVAEELAYITSGGLGGLFCLGLGATFILRAELHDHWRALDRVEAAIRENPKPAGDPEPATASSSLPDVSREDERAGAPRRRKPLGVR